MPPTLLINNLTFYHKKIDINLIAAAGLSGEYRVAGQIKTSSTCIAIFPY